MKEQVTIGDFLTNDEKAYQTYQLIEPVIRDVIRKNFLFDDDLCFKKNKGYWSVIYFGLLLARIKFGKKVSFVAIDRVASQKILEETDIVFDVTKSDQEFARILIKSPEDIQEAKDVIAGAIQKTLDNSSRDFDCCGQYKECSDARRCIHPDNAIRLGCTYRKNLVAGRIFYGENSNVE